MPPKPGGKAAGKGPPAAMLAKLKAQMEAQKKAEEDFKAQQEAEERKRKEEERIAAEEARREREEREARAAEVKVAAEASKIDKKREEQLLALERMRAAGMIVPDLPPAKSDKPAAEKPAPKPKPKAKHVDPVQTKAEAALAAVAAAAAALVAAAEANPEAYAAASAKPEKSNKNAAKAAAKPKSATVSPKPTPAQPAEDEIPDDWECAIEHQEEIDANKDAAKAKAIADEKKRIEEEKEKAREEETRRKKEEEAFIGTMRSPICCVLGHVDTGKTSLLDRIRRTNVQGGEAGGITQQIGATFFPRENLVAATSALGAKHNFQMKVPGLLVIDTPGHESFTNLRSRGSSLCDIAVLVVDLMHGLEPQTKESIRLLRERKCPFIVALNKVDRLYEWTPTENLDIEAALAKQKPHVLSEFDTRLTNILVEFQEQGLNAALYYKNKDVRNTVSVVPTSAHTGEGICDLLMLMIQLVQRFMEGKVSYKSDLACTVLEVKPVQGFGTTIDVVLVNGTLHAGDKIMVCGMAGPITTTVRALLTPQPMKELRVKGEYVHHQMLRAAMGLKIAAPELDQAVPGTPLVVIKDGDDLQAKKDEVMKDYNSLLTTVKKDAVGVAVQSSTLGSLEALLAFLDQMKIPVCHIALGPIHKKHLQTVVGMKDRNPKFGVMLAFDVPVAPEAAEVAEKNGLKIFTAKIIYHLFDAFTKYCDEWDAALREKNRLVAVFPVVLKINEKVRAKDPMILAVQVVRGQLHPGAPLIVQADGAKVFIGRVASMEKDHKEITVLKTGQDAAVKINHPDSITFGRHFSEANTLTSAVTRESIDALKESFRKDMSEDDWYLVKELKKEQGIK